MLIRKNGTAKGPPSPEIIVYLNKLLIDRSNFLLLNSFDVHLIEILQVTYNSPNERVDAPPD